MGDLFSNLKSFVLGITTLISTATSPALPASTIQATPTPTPTVVQKDIVTRSGEYSYSNYTVRYEISVPEKGGPITGSVSGVCEGPITGNFTGGEGGNIEGQAEATCKVAIFSYNLKVNYTGKLYLKEGKVDVNWTGNIPYTQSSGSLTLNFEGAK